MRRRRSDKCPAVFPLSPRPPAARVWSSAADPWLHVAGGRPSFWPSRRSGALSCLAPAARACLPGRPATGLWRRNMGTKPTNVPSQQPSRALTPITLALPYHPPSAPTALTLHHAASARGMRCCADSDATGASHRCCCAYPLTHSTRQGARHAQASQLHHFPRVQNPCSCGSPFQHALHDESTVDRANAAT